VDRGSDERDAAAERKLASETILESKNQLKPPFQKGGFNWFT
jgi:hypothetical protein